jgi:arylsulfatase A-like enzyme/thiamine biosynthesis lipoprotein ApbE
MLGTLTALLLTIPALYGADDAPVANQELQRFEYAETHMGTEFRLVLYAADQANADAASRAAFARIGELDGLLSDYQAESELNRLNAQAREQASGWVEVGSDLWGVLRQATQISQLSNGAFDVTVGECVRLWRRSYRQKELPTSARLQDALSTTSWSSLELSSEGQNVRLGRAGMRLDLGGIAKGYALDEALRTLRSHGVAAALVDGGGDVAVGDAPPQREGWIIALSEGEWHGQRSVTLVNEALATSGDRYQHVLVDGKRYSHIIDPTTGLGLTQPRAATVRAPSAMVADAWASALCVLGQSGAAAAMDAAGDSVEGIVFEAASTKKDRLNIVFILADDLGWNDLACQGSDYYLTPNLDRLARDGMRFSSAYASAANCAPTRAALMSGLYAPRTGIYTVGSGARGKAKDRKLTPPKNQTELHGTFYTMAECLQRAGYRTGHFGKWHLGGDQTTNPEAQGFEVNIAGAEYGTPPSYFWPYQRTAKDPKKPGQRKVTQQLPGLEDGKEGEYLTNRLTDEALKFLEADDGRPFFLYLPHYAVHTPIKAPRDEVWQWKKKPLGVHQQNPTYATMIDILDRNVGRIMDKLDELGMADNTLVVFTSDNGGYGGYQDMGIDMGNITHNFPLRGGKGTYYEGGIRVPLIMRWPGRIAAQSVQSLPVTTVDFYPTFVELAGAQPPAMELDGRNLAPLWQPQKQTKSVPSALTGLKTRPIFWHMPGYLNARTGWRTTPVSVVRKGQYKLLEFLEDGRLELYDLDTDISERMDLSASHPELRDALHAELQQWRESVAAPMPTPK